MFSSKNYPQIYSLYWLFFRMPIKKYGDVEERKAAKAVQDRQRAQARVYIKGEFSRWTQVGIDQGLDSAEDIARFLLDM